MRVRTLEMIVFSIMKCPVNYQLIAGYPTGGNLSAALVPARICVSPAHGHKVLILRW